MTANTANYKPKSKPRGAETKIAKVTALLQRKRGATLQDMIKTTGWQQHSVRAALTGLRKKGLLIERSNDGGASSYKIVETEQ